MTRFRLVVLVLLLSVLGALTISCSKKQDAMTLGAILPLSGRFAQLGEPIKDAMDLAVGEINASGGLLGRQMRIIYVDSQGDAKTGVTAAQRLIDVDHVDILTTFLTGVSEAVKPVAEERKVLLLAQTVSPTITAGATHTIRMHYSFVKDGELLAGHLREGKAGPIGFIRSRDPSTSYEVEKVIIPALRAAGISDIVDETFDVGNKDFKPQALRLKAAEVRQVCILGYGSDFPGVLRELSALGLLQAAELSGNLGFVELAADTPPELYQTAIFAAPPFMVNAGKSEMTVAFEANFTKQFPSAKLSYSAYYAYDMIQLIKHAAEKAHSTNPTALRKAIGVGVYNLMTGEYQFSKEGNADPPVILAKFQGEEIHAAFGAASAR